MMKTEREGGKKGKSGEGKKGRFGKIFPSNATKKKNPDIKYRPTVLNKNCTSPLGTSIRIN